MDTKDRKSGWMKAARVLAVAAAIGAGSLLVLGNSDRNAAGSRERVNAPIQSARGSEASTVTARADAGIESQRVPGHPELDLQLD
jgi:hypothetical protein